MLGSVENNRDLCPLHLFRLVSELEEVVNRFVVRHTFPLYSRCNRLRNRLRFHLNLQQTKQIIYNLTWFIFISSTNLPSLPVSLALL